ncbi:hypothetical protein [Streptomyces sp. NPDC051001]|uniref:hypothetical protein n=1 Tax=Streptomyces sp. NPDC051001 TaxID=3155795 RepID=UPI0034479D2C
MMPYFAGRRPTENAAVRRTPDHPAPAAPVPELRTRLCRAIAMDDGLGTRLLAHLMARASA